MTTTVKLSIEYFADPTKGRPISNGNIYVGIIDLDPEIPANQKQISVIQENGTSVEVSQPLNTSAGGVPLYNGSPVTITVVGEYSLKVTDKNDAQVYYVPYNNLDDSAYITAETIPDLRLLSGAFSKQAAHVLGYAVAGDGGGGGNRVWFTGQSPGTYVDNDSSIIVPTGGDGSSAWLWIFELLQSSSMADLETRVGAFDGQDAKLWHRTSANDGGGGDFTWDSGDLSTEVTGDQGKGVYIPPTSDTSGSSGAWVRQDKVFTVEMWGAIGDGTTDDYDAIQNALDYLDTIGGGRIHFENKIYAVETLIKIGSNIRLDLTNGATILRNFDTSANGVGLMLINADSDNAQILGGTLDGNGVNKNVNAFNILSAITVSNIKIIGVTLKDVVDFHHLDFGAASDILIDDCKFLGFWNKQVSSNRSFSEAIQLDPDIASGGSNNNRITIKNCTFAENPDRSSPWQAPAVAVGNHSGADTFYTDDIKITNCTFSGQTWAALRFLNFKNCIVTDNVFDTCNYGLWLTLNPTTGAPEGCQKIVYSNNTFNSMTRECLYNENPGTLTTVGYHKDIIMDSNILDSSTESFSNLRWSENVIISNNIIEEAKEICRAEFCNNVKIVNNKINTGLANGIWLYEINQAAKIGTGLTNTIEILNNKFKNNELRGIHVNCAAVGVRIKNNTIIDPDTDAGGRSGILVDSSADSIIIFGNDVLYTGAVSSTYGIEATSLVTDLTVSNNNSIQAPYGLTSVNAKVDILDTGTPEARISAAIGSMCRRLDTVGTSPLFIKQTGTGNTGWVAK